MQGNIPFDYVLYLVAFVAVLLTGVAKGGLGGSLAMLGTPMLSLVISPVRAAAIMLPILILMDAISVFSYRGRYKASILKTMLPGAMIGITIGWATASLVNDASIKIIIGTISFSFAIFMIAKEKRQMAPARENTPMGMFWGGFAGFTSFVAHAGGPPFQAYCIPLKLDPRIYVGTSVLFFAIVNAVKVIPYFALGQFSRENLHVSAMLLPVAVVGVLTGIWGVKKITPKLFYNITYAVMIMIGIKLLYDGISAL